MDRYKRYVFFSLVFIFAFVANGSAQTESLILHAPDGTDVSINRDAYGVPHISAKSEVGVFFGQGFAVAQDRLAQLDLHRRAAEGKLSESLGILALSMDQERRAVTYTDNERQQQFAALPVAFQQMLTAYTAGVNTYIDSMGRNPEKYRPLEFVESDMERWTVYKSVAVIQFLIRIFGQVGGEELDRLMELQDNGQQWLDENRPINDANVPTTVKGGNNGQPQKWHYSGLSIRPEVIRTLDGKAQQLREKSAQLGIPQKFGSFAALISTGKSATGNVMLLGAPQMGAPTQEEPAVTHEVELQCPAFHVGGMTVAGIPLVIIGHTETHAWTMTSGISDNSDVYIETTQDDSFGKYFHDGQWLDFEVVQDTIPVLGIAGGLPFTRRRTIHGPVFADDLASHQVFSMKMTFWNQELDMINFVLGVIKAKTLEEFEAAAALNPMSFNLFYAGKDQKIKYWHIGKYQDRSDGVDPRLPHNGDGSEEWGGFIPFDQLPSADVGAQDYFVNWNNKPVAWWNNGDNIAWTVNTNFGTRVQAMQDFVGPISEFTYENLKDIPRQIVDHGTYQQAIELSPATIRDENVVPPGQSGFISMLGVKSPHFDDQWPLHINWQFKDMSFGELVTGIDAGTTSVPNSFVLHQNYPNPFNPETTIVYDLPETGHVRLQVFNIKGQLVATLQDGTQLAGTHKTELNGAALSTGVYFYKLTTGRISRIGKGLLLK